MRFAALLLALLMTAVLASCSPREKVDVDPEDLFSAAIESMPSPTPKPTPVPTPTPNRPPFEVYEAKIKTGRINEYHEAYVFEMEYPIIIGFRSAEEGDLINGAFAAVTMQELNSEVLEQAENRFRTDGTVYKVKQKMSIPFNRANLVSVVLERTVYADDLAVEKTVESFPVRTDLCRVLLFDEFFSDPAAARALIEDRVRADFAESLVLSRLGHFEGLSENPCMYAAENGFVLVFQPGEAADPDAGVIEIDLPYELLDSVIKPNEFDFKGEYVYE